MSTTTRTRIETVFHNLRLRYGWVQKGKMKPENFPLWIEVAEKSAKETLEEELAQQAQALAGAEELLEKWKERQAGYTDGRLNFDEIRQEMIDELKEALAGIERGN